MRMRQKLFPKIIAVLLTAAMAFGTCPAFAASPPGSSDNGDGTYSNPFIWADVPDPDIIRVGDTYWMSSTTMHMNPGVPIMKSYDLVNWETVSYCYGVLEDVDSMKLQTGGNMYSNGTWASTLRYKNGTFYLIVPSNTTRKTYIFQTEDPENQPWRRYEINRQFHDCGLLMDDDGRNWLVYGNNPLYIIELNADVTGLKEGAAQQVILQNIHAPDPITGVTPTSGLAEGAHIQKINGKYFIFCITWPSGKPRTEVAHRADSLMGPYEAKVIAQENVSMFGSGGGGPAQGGLVEDGKGNWYGFVFRDSGSVGRIPWLMPITWADGWPMFGKNADGTGSYTNLPRTSAIPVQGMEMKSVVSSDEFYNNAPKPLYNDSQITPLPTTVPPVPTRSAATRAADVGTRAVPGVGDELIKNGGFEDSDMSMWVANDVAVTTRTDVQKAGGSYSGYVTGRTTTGSGPAQRFAADTLVTGGVYEVSCKVYYDDATAPGSPATKQFYYDVRGGGSYSSSYNPIRNMVGRQVPKGQWTTLSGTYTVPADLDLTSQSVFIETVWTGSPSATADLFNFYVDDVSMKVLSVPTPPEPPGPKDPVVIDDSLMLWYKMDEASGTEVKDSSGNNYNGTMMNGASFTGESVSLAGSASTSADTGQYINLPRNILEKVPGDFTVSTWVKNRASGQSQWVRVFDFGPGNSSNIMFLTARDFQFSMNNNSGGANAVTAPTASMPNSNVGKWLNVIVSHQGDTTRMYVNGDLVASGTQPATAPRQQDTGGFYIGRANWLDPFANMEIKDFRIYNRALTAAEASLIFGNDYVEPEPEPDDFWKGMYNYNGSNLKLDWQWNHNPDNRYWSLTERAGWMRLRNGYISSNIINAPNLLTQRAFGPRSSAVVKIDVANMKNGDEAGLSLFTAKYGSIGVKMEGGSKYIATTLANSWSSGHTTNAGAESARVALSGNTVYLKADANFYGQADRGDFYYSLDGATWTKLGGILNMTYSTSNHFMGYRFALYNFAKTSTGGYVDFDYYRISDKLTGDTAATVLGVEMQGAAGVAGNAASVIDVPVRLDPLPDGTWSELSASFALPKDLTAIDVVFGGDLTAGKTQWKQTGNQLELKASGNVALRAAAGKALFATLKLRVNKLQPVSGTVSVIPDYVAAYGSANAVYNVDGVKADIGLLAAESAGAWAKLPGYSNSVITHKYGADPYVLEYDGRIYLYMTDDDAQYQLTPDTANSYSNCRSVSIVSSADMVNWTDHGKVPVGRQLADGLTSWASNAWAPAAAVKKIDGKDKFFLYFADSANGVGVLTADSPIGPFTDPLGRALISRSTPNSSSSAVPWLFDPAVLVDDDGRAYLYYGGGIDGLNANEPKSARCVELGADMISIVGTPQEINAPGLFEDSGMHKYNGLYYYSYCSNFSATNVPTGTIHYMVSDNPLGPFTYVGAILPGPGVFGNGDGGNNHHAIFTFQDRWFITYHTRQVNIAERQSEGKTGSRDYRSPSITEIRFDADGKIIPLQMERYGVAQTAAMNPYERVQGETIGWNAGIKTKVISEAGGPIVSSLNMALTKISDGDWLAVGQADFGEDGAKSFTAKVAPIAGGSIEIRLDSLSGPVIGTLAVPAGDGSAWQTAATNIEAVTGTHDLFFRYKARPDSTGDLFDIDWWQFAKDGGEPPETVEVPFDVITEPFEYWQDFTGVLLHMGKTLSEGDVDKDTFKVHAKNTFLGDGRVLWNDYRTITDVYVADAEGNKAARGDYIMIKLLHGVVQSGATWRTSIEESRTALFAGDSARSTPVTIEYTITQLKEIAGIGICNYKQNQKWVDKIVDQFKMGTFAGANGNMNYAFYSPADTDAKRPLVIWLHGMGEGGAYNGVQITANRVTSFIGDEFKSIVGDSYVLAPQCPTQWPDRGFTAMSGYIPDLTALIDKMIAENPGIDTDRIYIGGLSMGGFMTMQMIITDPGRYAAAFMAAPFYVPSAEQSALLKNLPIYIVYSDEDTTVRPSVYIDPTVARLREAGVPLKVGRFPNVIWDGLRYSGHDSWIYIYNNAVIDENGESIFEWLAKQRRWEEPPQPQELEVKAVAGAVGGTASVVVDVYSGPEALSANLIVAAYNKKGQMAAYRSKEIDLAGNSHDMDIFGFDLSQEDGECTFKVFLWDKTTAAPLIEAVLPAESTTPLVSTAPETFCNPINISYRYQVDEATGWYRAMADTQPVYYKGQYWLFPTCASGYFYSDDLINWEFVYSAAPQIDTYAPGAFAMGDYLYVGRFNGNIYKSNNPKDGNSWQAVRAGNTNYADPYFFMDDETGRLFVLYGCSGLTDAQIGVTPAIRILELDTASPTLAAKAGQPANGTPVLYMNRNIHGYEVPGQLNDNYASNAQSWLEGAGMIKHNGKYYVYYCGPGTEYAGYSDACYVADDPLGPYTWCDNSPFVYKSTGFTVGAAHGHHVVEQTSGRIWKFGTIAISNRHIFERRASLYPVDFNANGQPTTDLTQADYPMYVPTSPKGTFEKQGPGWNLVSYGLKATASSTYDVDVVPVGATKMAPFHIGVEKAFDESIRTWWSAETGDAGEWLMGDLGKEHVVNAVQLNFADQDAKRLSTSQPAARAYDGCYRYLLEYSLDGETWFAIADKSDYTAEPYKAQDYSHDYYELVRGIPMRYIRVTNKGPVPAEGKFAISDLRLFGEGGGTPPEKVESFTLSRVEGRDGRTVQVSWEPVASAEGYIIRFGSDPEDLNLHHKVIGRTSEIIPILSTHTDATKTTPVEYYFRIDSYNNSGLTVGTKVVKLS